jgi:1,4-dihydroxy-2-naphthoate octaprenyltransferase
LFFGFLSVIGVFGLYGEYFRWILVLPAVTIGLWSTAVLNLNNMRDVDNDRDSEKRTLVVFMGGENARYYHSFLILFGFLSWFFFIAKLFVFDQNWFLCFALIPSFWIFRHLRKVFLITDPIYFDGELKKVALVTFFSSLILAMTLFIT